MIPGKAGVMKKRLAVCGALLFLATAFCHGEELVPLKALRPDGEHDVIVLEECHLAFRFAKESSFPAPMKAYQAQGSPSFFFNEVPAASFCLYEDLSGIPAGGELAQRLTVECFPVSSLDGVNLLTFQENIRKSFLVGEVPIKVSQACDAIGLDVGSSYLVEGAQLFQARAQEMEAPDGRVQQVPICLNIFIIKSEEFYYLFALQKGDPFEPGTRPYRISFEARIDIWGRSRASGGSQQVKPESTAW